jgi:hypothetical protein
MFEILLKEAPLYAVRLLATLGSGLQSVTMLRNELENKSCTKQLSLLLEF